MPRYGKQKTARRKFKKRAKRTFKKKATKTRASSNLIVYMSPNVMPLPPRYRTKLSCALYGFLTAGAATGQMNVILNSVDLPFNTTATNFPNPSQAVATLQPTGLTQLFNASMYQAFRVYSSKIALEMIPSSLADTVECTITPSDSITVPTSTANAMTQPYSKQQFFSSSKTNNTRNKGQLVNYITQHKLAGVTKQAIENDLSNNFSVNNAVGTTEPNNIFFWVVNWATPNGANLALTVDYRVMMTYYVEFWNIAAASLTEV